MFEPQVVGIGFTALDVVMRMTAMPTWQEAPPLVDLELRGGGPVGTACVAAAKMGIATGFIGTAGSDVLADLKVASLERHGVDVSRIVRRDAPEDQLIMVYLDAQTGERIFAGVRGRDPLILQPNEIDFDYLLKASLLHLDGRHPKAALNAARRMRSAGKKVMFDGSATNGPISDEQKQIIRETDILICGRGFAPALTGFGELEDAGKACIEIGPDIVVLTEGEDGSYTFTAEETYHIPAFQVEVLDTTGAADVFHGAYLAALIKEWDHRRACVFATAAAALKCSRLGGRAGFPTFDETLGFLAARGISDPDGV